MSAGYAAPVEPGRSPQAGRRSGAALFITLTVVMMGFGIIIPIMPFYVESMGAGGRELGLLMATFAVMQFIFSPIWGDLSDSIGRRPVLIIGVAGCGLTQLLYGLSNQLWMLFVARVLSGTLSSATFPAAMAYVSDTTSDEERGAGMGAISAAMYLGIMLGPTLGGWLARYSLTLPFFVAAGVSAIVLLFVYLTLPESLPSELRQAQAGRPRGPDLREMCRSLRGPLGYLLFLAFMLTFGLTNFWGIFGLYALQRYGYGPERVGTVLALVGVCSAIVQAFMVGPLCRRHGEGAVVQASLLASAVGFVLMLAATDLVAVVLTTCFFAAGNATLRPVVSTLISKRASQGQGTAMGLNNAFSSLGQVVGPIWAGLALDLHVMLPYLSGAVIMAAGFFTTIVTPAARAGPASARGATGEPT